jgi:uncharacterized SAM-binding protein YcdF (DUF218 family)
LNDLLTMLGIQNWKPLMTALILPPVPLMLCFLLSARGLSRQRRWGWFALWLSLAAFWLNGCAGLGRFAEHHWMSVPLALSGSRVEELRALAAQGKVAIIVLGSGKESMAPEYRMSNLSASSLERLRYGVWLSRATQLPIGFSGGVGWAGQLGSDSEAKIAGRIAKEEFGQELTWIEGASRDTRENANLSVPMLQNAGIEHLIVVTHGWHMPRAIHAFESAAHGTVRIEAAPMGLSSTVEASILEWVPTADGFFRVRRVARELLGSVLGF